MDFEIKDNILIKYKSDLINPNESVIIPSEVITIGDMAFYKCDNLEVIKIPNSVTSIGKYAFVGCVNLKAVSVPAHLKGKIDGVFPKHTKITYR
ncbi:MAG: leucine-rich repeat domain-containing protein [Ruminococcus flavefaciens]|nr:leucine-rich repeat domain-containing protein [Ruminococcus flavefaciens]